MKLQSILDGASDLQALRDKLVRREQAARERELNREHQKAVSRARQAGRTIRLEDC